MIYYLNEAVDESHITFSSSFKDVKNITDSLNKKELSNICSGEFKNSPFVVYRKVVLVDNNPASFIDVYSIPSEMEKNEAVIVCATKKEYRGLGLIKKCYNGLESTIKNKGIDTLYWETTKSNSASSSIAKSLGFSKGEDINKDDDNYIKVLKGNLNEATNKSTMVNTIVFDFGGVLIGSSKEEEQGVMNYFMTTYGMTEKDLYNMIMIYYKTIQSDELMTELQARKLYKKNLEVEYPRFAHVSDELFTAVSTRAHVFDYTIPLLDMLRSRGYKLYYLSNLAKCTYEARKKKGTYDFIERFDGGLMSWETGTAKPDPKIYKMLANKYNLDMKSCMFVDDKDFNINAAKKLGFKTILVDRFHREKMAKQLYEMPDISNTTLNESFNSKINIIEDPTLVDIVWFMSNKDKYGVSEPTANAIIREYPKELRARSEIILFKDDMIFIRLTKEGYKFPGGGWKKDEPYLDAAMREAREETYAKTKNGKYALTYALIYNEVPNWVYLAVPSNHIYYGAYTKLFIGEYDGKYTGYVRKRDINDKMKTECRFYKIDEVYNRLYPHHQKAVDMYLESKGMPLMESSNSKGILYHGSHVDIKGKFIVPKNNSQEDNNYVFASKDRNFALHYAGKPWHDGIIYEGYYNSQLYLIEGHKGAFKEIFDTDGYIYTVPNSDNFINDHGGVYKSTSKVPIIRKDHISNVLEAIKKTNCKLYYYPEKPSWWKKKG